MKTSQIIDNRRAHIALTNIGRKNQICSSQLSTLVPNTIVETQEEADRLAHSLTRMYLNNPADVASRLVQADTITLTKALLVVSGEFPRGLLKPSYINGLNSLKHDHALRIILPANLESSLKTSLTMCASSQQKYNRTNEYEDGRCRNPVFRAYYQYMRALGFQHGLTLGALTIVVHPSLYEAGIDKSTLPRVKERIRRALKKALGPDNTAFVFAPEFAATTALHLHGIVLYPELKQKAIREALKETVAAPGKTSVTFRESYEFKRVMSVSESNQAKRAGNTARIVDKLPIDIGWADYCGKGLGDNLAESNVQSKILQISSKGFPSESFSKYVRARERALKVCASKIRAELRYNPISDFIKKLGEDRTFQKLYAPFTALPS
ncbi:hypothetical protein J6I92_08775 [Pseudidiomarina sp. 1APR75-15]|uniref:Uncharacterized protein n=1 Tax=Pseudidiomarina terrestris TaxID=2820060 RepID=A0ABT8MJB3_9GAMM|nr:hypothetical protein [Pseudidiomarina sp. 1APR75-15]MDN7129964.1 hypothetical protein [Pseudidiomarina sp. 1APR75-15]